MNITTMQAALCAWGTQNSGAISPPDYRAPLDVDGIVGPRTRQALRSFQAWAGLPSTGTLDDVTQAKLAAWAPPAKGARPFPFALLRGERIRDRICRLVRSCDGLSLTHNRERLAELVGRGVDDPYDRAVRWSTNCGTTALGVLAASAGGVDAARAVHPLLATPSVIGKSISWLMQIGTETGAWTPHAKDGPLPNPGDLIRYNTPGKNDDHVEWLLSAIDGGGNAQHGGGGRSNNAMTVGKGYVLASWGRPLVGFLDSEKLGLPASPDARTDRDAEPEAPKEPPGETEGR